MLPDSLLAELGDKELLDFGLGIIPGRFEFHDTHCITPTSLVLAYSLAVATSGKASRILMAGFDGYPPGDTRNDDVEAMLSIFASASTNSSLESITPTVYKGLASLSLYAL
jgi:4-hydroxy 2-oxovalerate aldolase